MLVIKKKLLSYHEIYIVKPAFTFKNTFKYDLAHKLNSSKAESSLYRAAR